MSNTLQYSPTQVLIMVAGVAVYFGVLVWAFWRRYRAAWVLVLLGSAYLLAFLVSVLRR